MSDLDAMLYRAERAVLRAHGCGSYQRAPDHWVVPADAEAARELCKQIARAAISAAFDIEDHDLLRWLMSTMVLTATEPSAGWVDRAHAIVAGINAASAETPKSDEAETAPLSDKEPSK